MMVLSSRSPTMRLQECDIGLPLLASDGVLWYMVGIVGTWRSRWVTVLHDFDLGMLYMKVGGATCFCFCFCCLLNVL